MCLTARSWPWYSPHLVRGTAACCCVTAQTSSEPRLMHYIFFLRRCLSVAHCDFSSSKTDFSTSVAVALLRLRCSCHFFIMMSKNFFTSFLRRSDSSWQAANFLWAFSPAALCPYPILYFSSERISSIYFFQSCYQESSLLSYCRFAFLRFLF